MRTIIAGSRDITQDEFDWEIQYLRHIPTAVISGEARGADKLGADWAQSKGIPVIKMPARWRDDQGMFDRGAGFRRNIEMANTADFLFAIWDGKSPGTKHMIDVATKKGLITQVCLISRVPAADGAG